MNKNKKLLGFTLIELLIAMLIGLLLLGGLIQIFIITRSNYRVQQSLNYMQENLRFADSELGYAVRMGGFFYTLASPEAQPAESSASPFSTTSGSLAIQGDSVLTIWGSTGALPPCGLANWAVGIQGFDGAAAVPSACLNTNYAPQTDVVAVTYLRPVFMGLEAIDVGAALASTVPIDNREIYALIFDQRGLGTVGISQAGLLGTGTDLAPFVRQALVASASSIDDVYKRGTGPERNIQRSAAMMPLVIDLFYVRKCSVLDSAGLCTLASDGGNPQPTLVRRHIAGDGTQTDEPLVDGIEQMQVEYLASGCPGYLSATDLTAWAGCAANANTATVRQRWQRVINTRLRVMARSAEFELTLNDTGPYVLSADTAAYNPAAAPILLNFPKNNQYRRTVRTLNIQPRNATRPLPPV
jgi:type IV pilus assembly protein PilW